MSFGSVKTEIILSTVAEELKSLAENAIQAESFIKTMAAIKNEFPQLSYEQQISILSLILGAMNDTSKEKVELVATAPISFNLKAKRTQIIVNDLLKEAKKNILITGYSVSNFISEYIDEIVGKSQRGVFVKIFINNIEQQDAIEKLLRYKSRFLQIYDYTSVDDKMAALHAKVISIDSKYSLVSSANLSYHGLSGNIEIGSLITSERISKQIDEIFKQLIFQKVFRQV